MHERGPLFTCVWLRVRAEIILITKRKKVFECFYYRGDRMMQERCAHTIVANGVTALQRSNLMFTEHFVASEQATNFTVALKQFIDRYFHTIPLDSLRYSGSHSQRQRWLKHQSEMALPLWVWDERWLGFGRFRTAVDDIGVYKQCAVISRVALCNRLSGKRGAGGMGWRRVCAVGCLRGGGGAGGGDEPNDDTDDKFMQLCDGSCNLGLQNWAVCGHMCPPPPSQLEQSRGNSVLSSNKWHKHWKDYSANWLVDQQNNNHKYILIIAGVVASQKWILAAFKCLVY